MNLQRLSTMACTLVLLWGCGGPERVEETRTAFGLPMTVELWTEDAATGRQLLNSVFEDVAFVAEVSDPWTPGPMARTNQLLATTGRFSANPSILPLIRRAQGLASESGGFFNPALGAITALWREAGDATPDEESLRALLRQRPEVGQVQIEGIQMYSINPAVRLDLSTLAMGHALDLAVAHLERAGHRHFRIRLGTTAGVARGDTAWLPVPLPDADPASSGAKLQGGGAWFTVQPHPDRLIIDPESGHPLPRQRAAGAVGRDLATAAAGAQAIAAAGREHWGEVVTAMELEHAFLVDEEGALHATAALAERLPSGNPRRPVSSAPAGTL